MRLLMLAETCQAPRFTTSYLAKQHHTDMCSTSILQLCNAGTKQIELDFCLSRHAHAANQRYQAYGDGPSYASWIEKALTASLDMVYYCWLEERDLARGAKYLAQVGKHL